MGNSAEKDGKQKELLYGLYRACAAPLSEQESKSLTPILNALQNPETRYGSPTLLAEGGEKQIYRVYDQHLNRFVAMAKALRGDVPDDQEQFLREGQLTANLSHPNIVPVHNMGIDSDGKPFFSMELLPGDSLHDMISKSGEGGISSGAKASLAALLDIFLKVCDAVAYAHSREVLHLDIKPDNIRVGQFGEVFLCDWGLSRVGNPAIPGEPEPGQLDGDLLNDITLTGTLKGTPGFMAPEQVTNQKKTVQTDIYALGAILYLILTHRLPVDGKTASEMAENTRKGSIIHPKKGRIPKGLVAVAMKALSLDPENRYKSVQALQSDVKRFLGGHPTEAENAGFFIRMVLLTQRHRELTFWMLAFLALLAVVMGIALSTIRKEKQSAELNLALYKAEQGNAQKMDRKLTLLSSYSRKISGYVSAISMISILNEMISKNADSEITQRLLLKKAWLHVVLEQFSEACQTFGKIHNLDGESRKIYALCQEYARLKPDDQALLSGGDLARLLTRRETIQQDLAFFIYYHHFRTEPEMDPEEYIKVVGAILARLNEMDEDIIPRLKLSRRPEGYHLDMSRTPYSNYVMVVPMVYRQNVFAPLHLYSLDISHSPVSLVRELTHMKVKELRMVGTSIFPVEGLVWSMKALGVERLILGKGEYPEKILQNLRNSGIEVVEVMENPPVTPVPASTVRSPEPPAS